MKKIRFLLGMSAVLAILFFSGCQDNKMNDQQSRLVIKLTDAPFPFDIIEAATVNITKVEIRKVTEGEEDGYPYMPLDIQYSGFNLLDLRGGNTIDLVDMEIDPGHYDLIRVYVDEAGLTTVEGTEYHLKVPSGEQTGIKVFVDPPLHVATGFISNLVLDFDVAESFVLKGNPETPAGIKGFNFKPVIKAVNETTEGSIKGLVSDSETPLENASVLLQEVVDQDTFDRESTATNPEGYYMMHNVLPGTYILSATLTGYDTVVYEDVEVFAGNLTIRDFTLTMLEEEEEAEEGEGE